MENYYKSFQFYFAVTIKNFKAPRHLIRLNCSMEIPVFSNSNILILVKYTIKQLSKIFKLFLTLF